MRLLAAPLLMLCVPGLQAAPPLPTAACMELRPEARRQACLRAAPDAPPSVTGKTYGTRDVPARGPAVIDQSAPAVPIVPYVNVSPPGQAPGRAR